MFKMFKKSSLSLLLELLMICTMFVGLPMTESAALDLPDGNIYDAEVLPDDDIGAVYISGGNVNYGVFNLITGIWTSENLGAGKDVALALDSLGKPHVAYIDSNDDLVYKYHDGTAWSSGETIDSISYGGVDGALTYPDIAIDGDGKAHIVYHDAKGGRDPSMDYNTYDVADLIYATNASGSFVKTVRSYSHGYLYSPDGWRNWAMTPSKITLATGNYYIGIKQYNLYKWISGQDHTYNYNILLPPATPSNDLTYAIRSASTNNDLGFGLYGMDSVGTSVYSLFKKSGSLYITNGATEVAAATKLFTSSGADLCISDSGALYYAAINGTDLLLYQNGAFKESLTLPASLHSTHPRMATVVSGSIQFVLYTDNNGKIRVHGVSASSDSTAPFWLEALPKASDATTTGFTANAGLDEPGAVYYLVVDRNATAPTASEVKAGINYGSVTKRASGNFSVLGNIDDAVAVTGLSATTEYDIYFIAQDNEGNLQNEPTKQQLTTASLSLNGSVAISGALKYNETLTATVTEAQGDASLQYQWQRNGSDISGATSDSYTTVQADIDTMISAVVTAANYSGSLSNTASSSIAKANGPAAPTDGTVDDTNNTFNWSFVTGIETAADYEYSVNGGSSWTTVTDKPINVGNAAIADGDLKVRVKATATHAAGSVLASTEAFTVALTLCDTPSLTVSGTTVSWSTVTGATSYKVQIYQGDGTTLVGDEISIAASTSSYDLETRTPALTIGDYKVKVKAIGDGTNYDDSPLSNLSEVITIENKTLHTVTFNSNGGSAVDAQMVIHNNTATTPTVPNKEGYYFAGWYSDEELASEFNFNGAITGDITLYAKWVLGITDADKVAVDKAALTWGAIKNTNVVQNSVTADLNLIVTGAVYGSTITWLSGEPTVISNTGVVTRPANIFGDANVTVTATVYRNGKSDTKDFTLKVLKLAPSTNAYLSGLSATGITLIPSFSSATTSYSASVVNSISSTTIATTAGNTATVKINGQAGASKAVDLSVGSNTITIEVTAQDGTTQKTYTLNISRSRGGGSSLTPNLVTPLNPVTITPSGDGKSTTATLTTNATPNETTGSSRAKVEASEMAELTSKAKESQRAGQKVIVEIKVDAGTEAKAVAVEIPRAAFDKVAKETKAEVKVNAGLGTITFSAKGVEAISGAADAGNISIGITRVEVASLTKEVQEKVGERPVFDFSVKAGNSQISTFGGGNAEISIPYAPKTGEKTNAIIVFYIDNSGKLNPVRGKYNPATGTVNFRTNHFSQYAVGYNEVSYKDVADTAWYKEAVDFIAARSITIGAGNGNFSPNDQLTRGQYLVMLMRAYGIVPAENPSDNFADGGNTYYTGYLAVAKGLGITKGIGNNLFAPDQEISRQEVFTMLYNALQAMGELPEGTAGNGILGFRDADQIAAWAKDAMTLFTQTGIINGRDGLLAPAATSTRAQMAQVLFNLLAN